MYPWYRGNGGQDFDLNADDIVGVRKIYGMEDERRLNDFRGFGNDIYLGEC